MILFRSKNILLLGLLFLFFIPLVTAQQKQYARVRIQTAETSLQKLNELGITVDHGKHKKNTYFIGEIARDEIRILEQNDIPHEVLIEDMTAYYKKRNERAMEKWSKSSARNLGRDRVQGCENGNSISYETPDGFSFGSMGGFLTYEEFRSELDSMVNQYPDLVERDTLPGHTTHEGRPIYHLKISDNPGQDEQEPEVLYSGLHHCREAASLSNLIFYMYYLLENYDSDGEVRYLVNNTQMHFVPMVNPDGYIYNQKNEPNGGGMWRKNRRDNGDGTFGVDLNRNYCYEWGYDDQGSSPDPDSDTYRGPNPCSEPETRAMMDLVDRHDFKIALNYHTYSELLIHPWGYADLVPTPPDSNILTRFGAVMTRENGYTVGNASQTVGYNANGSSDDWMFGEQDTTNKVYAYSPEAGSQQDGFWPSINRIVPLAKENLWQNLSAARLASEYAVANDAEPAVLSDASGHIDFELQRMGLGGNGDFTVMVNPAGPNISSTGSSKDFTSMDVLETRSDSISYQLAQSVSAGDKVRYEIAVDNGTYIFRDTITKTYGQMKIILAEEGNDLVNWNGNTNWGPTNAHFHSPSNSLTDSPNDQYGNDVNNRLILSNSLDLRDAVDAQLVFWAKWDIERNYDFVQVMASRDGGNTWTPLCGKHTKSGTENQDENEPLYDGTQNEWVQEVIDLEDYIGDSILIGFRLVSDQWQTDRGFWFDDLQVEMIPNYPVSVDENGVKGLKLGQPLPNPSQARTVVPYALDVPTKGARLELRDPSGRLIETHPLNEKEGRVTLDATELSDGVYFYRIVSPEGISESRRWSVTGP